MDLEIQFNPVIQTPLLLRQGIPAPVKNEFQNQVFLSMVDMICYW